ncbi:threonine dehydrogenase-like Zn-dependent dehydrogenase [Pseudonocardia hierapolitana]|uniref:Threonine dehydrogenase-like Zn-dependent dehydrogenase n=1 Tax=Pseudonocardia hierapolitana TaxID=1128676 RepID=A0A561SK30_9PSEU|nr:alcohol dehydrogenase catalytic domain-containing protein [Pseudonocardia hierapolitana]TWF75194.1 threonine dehydrogenase-like Zn-dependent dehydrogenase [Pseudonocardia hierapolitana]
MTAPANRRAARFRGEAVIDFTVDDLREVAPGEVRLRVDVCALCGSDKRLLAGGSAVVPGHEIAGTVVATGDGTSLPVGTRCIVYIPIFCGACDQCLRGQTNRCLRLRELIGWQRDGGFADVVDVPERCALPVPDDIGQDVAVLGLDTVGTAAHGLRLALRTQDEPPRRLLVVGCGPLGLGVVAVARAMGVEAVDAHDPHPGRLALAERLGAGTRVDLESENQYDVTVEVSGAAPARAVAQRVVVPGGAVLALGESNDPYTMPATPRWRRTDCFTVRSFYFPLAEVEGNWDLLRRCGPALRDVLAHPVTLPELAQAFEEFVAGDLLKPYIVSGAPA